PSSSENLRAREPPIPRSALPPIIFAPEPAEVFIAAREPSVPIAPPIPGAPIAAAVPAALAIPLLARALCSLPLITPTAPEPPRLTLNPRRATRLSSELDPDSDKLHGN